LPCDRGHEAEVYEELEAPPKSVIMERVRSDIDGLITSF
jgi:hypothetical protein